MSVMNGQICLFIENAPERQLAATFLQIRANYAILLNQSNIVLLFCDKNYKA